MSGGGWLRGRALPLVQPPRPPRTKPPVEAGLITPLLYSPLYLLIVEREGRVEPLVSLPLSISRLSLPAPPPLIQGARLNVQGCRVRVLGCGFYGSGFRGQGFWGYCLWQGLEVRG